MTTDQHPAIAGTNGLCVQFLGTALDGELLVVIGRGPKVLPASEIHHKTPSAGDWMDWGTVKDLGAWRPLVSENPRPDGAVPLAIPADPEIPAYNPIAQTWSWKGASVRPMDADSHTFHIGKYPLGGCGTLHILEWDR